MGESNAQDEFDYQALGLKVGIEIHQQLDSKGKLFCRCPTQLQGTRPPDFTLLRFQRPVLGETGQFDAAMLVEFSKRSSVIYEGFHDVTCSYELDETPPFKCDEECIDIALEICLLFKMDIVREMHVCRKNYVDGSVPAGFQRTMEIGQNGSLVLQNGKKIGIENIFLEEDAARKTKQERSTVFFRVDRLGIPLTEITTSPDIHDPVEARDAAYRIGLLLRSTNKVKHILGSTRQDINISIRGGERIEIKGVQKLDWIPPLIKYECQRQLALLAIRSKLQQRGIKADQLEVKSQDLSSIFQKTPCNFIHDGIAKGLHLIGFKLPGFQGIYGTEVQTNRRFGTEVAGKVRVLTGLKGLIHSDEDLLGKYQFTAEEITQTRSQLQVGDIDLFILLLGSPSEISPAISIIIRRSQAALEGVLKETRQAADDGTSEFLRELSGEKRLYPDTDTPAILIGDDRIERIRTNLGPYPWDLIVNYAQKYNVASDIFEDLVMTGKIPLFEQLRHILPDQIPLIIRTITDRVKELHRDQKNIENLCDNHFIQIIEGVKRGDITKDAIDSILSVWTETPELPLNEAKQRAGISSVDLGDLEHAIAELIQKNAELVKLKGKGAVGPLMGDLMATIGRGSVDGKTLSVALMKGITQFLEKTSPSQKSPKESKSTKGGVK